MIFLHHTQLTLRHHPFHLFKECLIRKLITPDKKNQETVKIGIIQDSIKEEEEGCICNQEDCPFTAHIRTKIFSPEKGLEQNSDLGHLGPPHGVRRVTKEEYLKKQLEAAPANNLLPSGWKMMVNKLKEKVDKDEMNLKGKEDETGQEAEKDNPQVTEPEDIKNPDSTTAGEPETEVKEEAKVTLEEAGKETQKTEDPEPEFIVLEEPPTQEPKTDPLQKDITESEKTPDTTEPRTPTENSLGAIYQEEGLSWTKSDLRLIAPELERGDMSEDGDSSSEELDEPTESGLTPTTIVSLAQTLWVKSQLHHLKEVTEGQEHGQEYMKRIDPGQELKKETEPLQQKEETISLKEKEEAQEEHEEDVEMKETLPEITIPTEEVELTKKEENQVTRTMILEIIQDALEGRKARQFLTLRNRTSEQALRGMSQLVDKQRSTIQLLLTKGTDLTEGLEFMDSWIDSLKHTVKLLMKKPNYHLEGLTQAKAVMEGLESFMSIREGIISCMAEWLYNVRTTTIELDEIVKSLEKLKLQEFRVRVTPVTLPPAPNKIKQCDLRQGEREVVVNKSHIRIQEVVRREDGSLNMEIKQRARAKAMCPQGWGYPATHRVLRVMPEDLEPENQEPCIHLKNRKKEKELKRKWEERKKEEKEKMDAKEEEEKVQQVPETQ